MRDTCWYCGGKLIWQSDFNLDEVFGQCESCTKLDNEYGYCDGIATYLTCSNCGAEVTYAKKCNECIEE